MPPKAQKRSSQHVRLPRVADLVAEQIRESIISGELQDGDRLPRLEVLVDDYGVSGPSMREALRILEAEGLISVVRGSQGGAIVHRLTNENAAYTIALVLQSREVKVGDVAHALFSLEPTCAMLCAMRSDRKRAVVRDLRKINEQSQALLAGGNAEFSASMNSFHETVVNRCGNETLRLLAGALESVWRTNATADDSREVAFLHEKERVDALRAHEKVCDAIEAGDRLRAASLLTEHLIEDRFVTGGGEGRDQVIDAQPLRGAAPI